MKQRAEFLKEASNVYRTPHYIVRQRLGLLFNVEESNQLISRDTYYERTPERDFNERFGRCDIEPINDRTEMGSAMAYIMKYIETSGEKIVYSRGLPRILYQTYWMTTWCVPSAWRIRSFCFLITSHASRMGCISGR